MQLSTKKMKEEACQRSSVYSLLSIVFRQEPTAELLKHIRQPGLQKALSDLNISVGIVFSDVNEEQALEKLVLEYTRLFLGPGKHISPHESVHRSDETHEGLLWGKSTAEFKQFVEWLGLSFDEDFNGIPDHISVELECMQKLTEREAEAWKEGDGHLAVRCLNQEKWFIKEHLSIWIPGFCNKIIEKASFPFYKEFAVLLNSWISLEKKHLN